MAARNEQTSQTGFVDPGMRAEVSRRPDDDPQEAASRRPGGLRGGGS